MRQLPTRVDLTPEQDEMMVAARVAFYKACPFFCSFYYDQLQEYPTLGVPTAATDGRRVFINPEYVFKLRIQEIVFVIAHETYHAVWRHVIRMKYYMREKFIESLPFDPEFFNTCADYVINADLLDLKIGQMNPNWLHHPEVNGSDLVEEVYVKLWVAPPPPPPGGGGQCEGEGEGEGGSGGGSTGTNPNLPKPSVYGKGSRPDHDAKDGRFDELLEPFRDPVSGKEDISDEVVFKEAVARAEQAAKAVGNMPGSLQRLVDQILEPQVDWKEHVRMLITGKVGNRRETWLRPNRRRLVLNPIVIMPGKQGHGCELVAVWIDNSGSVGKNEYNAFFSEVGGIMNDVRPKRMFVGWCDAKVQRTAWVESLDEVFDRFYEPTPGGGGTSFIPPFAYMIEHEINPETLVYLTDMMGPFPRQAPDYPVVWCASTAHVGPWGETVRIRV